MLIVCSFESFIEMSVYFLTVGCRWSLPEALLSHVLGL